MFFRTPLKVSDIYLVTCMSEWFYFSPNYKCLLPWSCQCWQTKIGILMFSCRFILICVSFDCLGIFRHRVWWFYTSVQLKRNGIVYQCETCPTTCTGPSYLFASCCPLKIHIYSISVLWHLLSWWTPHQSDYNFACSKIPLENNCYVLYKSNWSENWP